ncbi:MAG: hypothetical protein JWQ63_2078 [Mucilaginibacter sp.]|nr:hypothetical protein [Mucilaginibacter sp.]
MRIKKLRAKKQESRNKNYEIQSLLYQSIEDFAIFPGS